MGGEVFALLGGLTYYLPKMTGRKLNERAGRPQFWVMFIAFNSTFLCLLAVGMLGMTRRVISYQPELQGLNIAASISAFVLGASMLFWLGMIIWSLILRPALATQKNPWESLGIEWQLPTPVPTYNFDTVPVAWSLPYEYDTGQPAAVPGRTQPALAGGTPT